MSSSRRNNTNDNEAILISLDQLNQTLEVMGQVISRIRHQLTTPVPQDETRNRRSTDIEERAPLH